MRPLPFVVSVLQLPHHYCASSTLGARAAAMSVSCPRCWVRLLVDAAATTDAFLLRAIFVCACVSSRLGRVSLLRRLAGFI